MNWPQAAWLGDSLSEYSNSPKIAHNLTQELGDRFN